MRTGNNAGFQIHKMVEFEETALDVKGRFRAVETVVGALATAAEKLAGRREAAASLHEVTSGGEMWAPVWLPCAEL